MTDKPHKPHHRVLEEPFSYRNEAGCRAWDIQAQETAREYCYFAEFLKLGSNRSLKLLSSHLAEQKALGLSPLGSSYGDMMRRSAIFKWAERAELYERDLAQKLQREETYRRREKLRLELAEYQQVQHQMSRGLASLSGKILRKVTMAVDNATDDEWTLDRACRLITVLNQTVLCANGMWSDSLGVQRLLNGIDAMDQKVSKALPSANAPSA